MQASNKDTDKNTNKDRKQENGNNGSGWLGGFFGKLSLRPKNEMKLPDDKNKSVSCFPKNGTREIERTWYDFFLVLDRLEWREATLGWY